jgi:hypothetical protein
MMIRQFARTSVAMLLSAAMTGCGGSREGGSEPNRARLIVGEMSDNIDNPARFAKLFAQGAAPPDAQRRRYGQYRIWAKSADVSGDTATLTIELKELRTNKILEDRQWTAVKEGDTWKLKDAPLP